MFNGHDNVQCTHTHQTHHQAGKIFKFKKLYFQKTTTTTTITTILQLPHTMNHIAFDINNLWPAEKLLLKKNAEKMKFKDLSGICLIECRRNEQPEGKKSRRRMEMNRKTTLDLSLAIPLKLEEKLQDSCFA